MQALFAIILIVLAACGATEDIATTGYMGIIACFSDSPQGTKMAESAAGFLSSRGEEQYYSRSFVVTGVEGEGSNRFLILILSPEGEKAFEKSRHPFKKSLIALLKKMSNHFGDNKVSAVIQKQDKTNVIEALFNNDGAATIKNLQKGIDTDQDSSSP